MRERFTLPVNLVQCLLSFVILLHRPVRWDIVGEMHDLLDDGYWLKWKTDIAPLKVLGEAVGAFKGQGFPLLILRGYRRAEK